MAVTRWLKHAAGRKQTQIVPRLYRVIMLLSVLSATILFALYYAYIMNGMKLTPQHCLNCRKYLGLLVVIIISECFFSQNPLVIYLPWVKKIIK